MPPSRVWVQAEDPVRSQSKEREKIISDCLGVDITLPRWYGAVFNNGRQSVDTRAQACRRMIQCAWPDKADSPRIAASTP